MKNGMLLLLSLLLVTTAMAQLTTKKACPDFEVDILDGKVNGVKPTDDNGKVKRTWPCFTSTAEEKDSAKCGTSVFFKDKDIYFYTQRNYIEIGPKFKGKLSIPLLGAKRSSMFQYLGNPVMKDDDWDAFKTSYGILVTHYDAAGKVKNFQITTQGTHNLSLCE
jgi:hypothetical protein